MSTAIIHRKPWHDQVVLLHLQGVAVGEIAKAMAKSVWTVRNVIKDPRSQAIVMEAKTRWSATIHEKIDTKMVDLGVTAVGNLTETLEAEIPVNMRLKEHQDKMSLALLDRIGHGVQRQEKGDSGIKLDRDLQERMVTALETSDQKRKVFDSAEEAEWHEAEEEESSPLKGIIPINDVWDGVEITGEPESD
jgi:hypothetical protein